MTSSTTTTRRRPRLRLLSALMLSYGMTPSQCFQPVNGLSVAEPTRTTTRRFFRDTQDPTDTSSILNNNPLMGVSSMTQSTQSTTSSSSLPSWLADSKESLWESNWYTLEEAMLQGFFTPTETQQLLQTIETAACNDRHQMASAAEFCLILVETMEMGLTALMAAAYHVCACVTARLSTDQGDLHAEWHSHYLWDPSTSTASTSSTNSDVIPDHQASLLIAKDAGRLKKLETVAAMIYSPKSQFRVTPDAQDAKNLKSLLLTETKDWRALALRTAAALYRLRGVLARQARLRQTHTVGAREIPSVTPEALQCSREALYIYAPLASRLGMHRLKNELEGVAFRILYRRQYEQVNRLARELRPRHSKPHLNRGLVEMCDNSLDVSSCMKSVLEAVKADMTSLLEQDAYFSSQVADFTVTARVKEPYSLWKKMLRNKCKHIMQVPDAIALRIVLDAKVTAEDDDQSRRTKEIDLCYYAQQLCMEHWQPVLDNPRFKDYIEAPKRNGYQSLHYTAHTMWDDEDWNLEIQVRSGEMHQVAEFGLASHWDYKAQSQQSHLQQQKHMTSGGYSFGYQHQNQHRQQQHHFSPYNPQQQIQPQHTNTHAHPYDNYNEESEVTMYKEPSVSDVYLRGMQEELVSGGQSQQWMLEEFGAAQQDEATAMPYSTAPSQTEEAVERASRIRARTKKLQPYIEALTTAQSDLAREHVFCFLTTEEQLLDDNSDETNHPNGQPGTVLALPAGACVLDALREGERQLGIVMPKDYEIRVNGEWSNKVTAKLQNGDILTVPLGYHHQQAMA